MRKYFLKKPLIWFRRLFQAFILVLTVSLVPCMVYWFRTGNSRGLTENAMTDAAGIRIQVNNGKVNNSTVNVENFLIFMISVDYQPGMEEEALKAFAVAARSSLYAHLNRYFQETEDSDSGEKAADDSVGSEASGETSQKYRTVSADELGVRYHDPGGMACAFGEAAELEGKEHWSDIYRYVKKAVEMTGGQYLTYTEKNGETGMENTVDALWHAYSAGNTRFYEGNLTGEDDGISLYSPQLKSMDGKDSRLARAVTITVYSRRKLAELLWEIPGTEDILEGKKPLSSYMTIENRDSAGYITEMSLGSRKMTGEEAAQLLQVSSGCFYVSDLSGGSLTDDSPADDSPANDNTADDNLKNDSLKIVTFGSGRGYGMSLAGASVMASQGAGYREILEYYFPVCRMNNSSSMRTE